MGLNEGRLTGREDGKNRDGDKTVRLLQTEVSSEQDIQTVELIDTFGSESNPPDNSKVFHLGVGTAWQVALSVVDGTPLQLEGKKGAKQKYSTNEAGTERIATITMDNDGTITLTNSSNVSIILKSNEKVTISNNTQNLRDILDSLMSAIQEMDTFGSPTRHSVHPSSKAVFASIRNRLDYLME
ncbi:MAG: hypothetical protein KAR42_15110 [candidate division Zixibacteria bacterium]|nr:hypothetical protein [candidate division Zixibacteria bacterium]